MYRSVQYAAYFTPGWTKLLNLNPQGLGKEKVRERWQGREGKGTQLPKKLKYCGGTCVDIV